ncbi:VanW family protein [Halalkalibacter krulwichiae]|uniref:Vancomycin B-type resistance protein VanW n=1 Tax=Halalkalibacter krulwichiae TaxID=199441 RepID=A0A1X9MA23_9BACI|nr:VanW family protein [Halalkalibacter krulwichiae]ARK30257.1 Vancomycin B-type resistance protein VanW [Halalkalibacter krulwichiae]
MKFVFVFITLLLLAGCNGFAFAENPKIVAAHSSYFVNEVKAKAPVYWPVELIDEWNDTVHSISMNDYGYLFSEKIDNESLSQLASKLASQIDSPMENARVKPNDEFDPGKKRVILSESELVESLLNLEVGTKELILPIYVTEPTVTKNDITGIEQRKIGEFKTFFNPSVTGRSQNVLLSAEAISGIVLGPGDSFSFNQMVGERTRERGYQEAMEIVDKEFVMGIGGGICQTSSTLFNAVDKAGLEMIERYTHSREIGYVPTGRDATVSWGGPDFRFSNPHPYPVIIRSNVDLQKGELLVSVHTK